MSESMETIRDEFALSQKRSYERRLKTVKRSHFWAWFWLVWLLVAWIVVGLWALGII